MIFGSKILFSPNISLSLLGAGVAKPGQRRSPEAAIPQGFVGSNPTPRTISALKNFRQLPNLPAL